MAKLKFEEHLPTFAGEVLKSKIDDITDKVVGTTPMEETQIEKVEGPLKTDQYKEIIDTIQDHSKTYIIRQKQKAENLFATKSVIAIIAFGITSILTSLDQALVDGTITSREWIQVGIALVGSASVIASRGAEGSTGVYTPHGLPGLHKEDYDGDGIIDKLDKFPTDASRH